jgi:hypothetical protein
MLVTANDHGITLYQPECPALREAPRKPYYSTVQAQDHRLLYLTTVGVANSHQACANCDFTLTS